MPHRHEMVSHYGTQILGPLQNILDLFLKHHSGCSKSMHLNFSHQECAYIYFWRHIMKGVTKSKTLVNNTESLVLEIKKGVAIKLLTFPTHILVTLVFSVTHFQP